jgi:hypothetical protein
MCSLRGPWVDDMHRRRQKLEDHGQHVQSPTEKEKKKKSDPGEFIREEVEHQDRLEATGY